MRDRVVHGGIALILPLIAICAACGGGGGGGTAIRIAATPTATATAGPSNVQPISVNPGPTGKVLNGLFTSVTICVPGTATCQMLDNVLVDTGSPGLRVLGSELTIALPQQMQGGSAVGECALFAGGFTWGPVSSADVKVAGEAALDVPVQVIGAPGFAPPPANCTNTGLPPLQTLSALGAKGILGVDVFVQDCGAACAINGPANPGFYFVCPSSGCTSTAEPLDAQVQNPVALFAADNNGVMVSLPAIGAGGAPSVGGSLIFGIGTQANNALGSAQVFSTDSFGDFTTNFQGNSYPGSFIDSGSSAIFFLSSAITGIPACSDQPMLYCPASTQSLSAQNVGNAPLQSGNVDFQIANGDQLISTSNDAFNDLGGPGPGNVFDWGMPFLFGRNVFVAIEGQPTPAGPGPYFAY